MKTETAMRSGKDRLRYSLAFEVSLMTVLIPAGVMFLDKSFTDMGILGVALSLKALLVSLIFNWIFDRFEARRGVLSSDRSTLGRLLHAVGFELSLLITSLPLYMWWLGLTFFEAVAADLIVTSFVVVYTYFFTLGYDRLYPMNAKPSLATGLST